MILNEDELSIIQDKQFFELKQSALGKIEYEFSKLKEVIKNHIFNSNCNLPNGVDVEIGKISKGENYKGLPYRILDFPRLFSQDGIFAYRVMFWWSKGFYFTLHISGKYLDDFLNVSKRKFLDWKGENVFYYNHNQEWQHEVEMPFYFPIEDVSFNDLESIAKKQGYLKIARKLDIHQIDDLKVFGLDSFQLFV